MDTTTLIIKSLSKQLDSIKSGITKIDSNAIANQISQDKTFAEIQKNLSTSYWTPIIVALISAGIGTLLAQLIDRYKKRKVDEGKDIREIKSNSVNLLMKLKEAYRQVAMYKFHAQYWWYCHSNEANGINADAYYNYHLISQTKAQAAEEKIGEINADFFALVTKYEKIKGKKFNVDDEKSQINLIKFPKAKEYSSNISYADLRNSFAEKDEEELRNEFYKNLPLYQAIINKM